MGLFILIFKKRLFWWYWWVFGFKIATLSAINCQILTAVIC